MKGITPTVIVNRFIKRGKSKWYCLHFYYIIMDTEQHRSRSRSRSRSPSREKKNGDRASVKRSIGNKWYCLKCREHTKTVNIVRKTFLTKRGVKRHYHEGRCYRCDARKANMTPW